MFVCVVFDIFAQDERIIEMKLLNSTNYQHKLKLSDIATDVEYVPLETTAKSLIGKRIGHCKLSRDYIFMIHGGILQFTRNGKFVRQINTVGQGPGEGLARCCAFDEKKQLIYMYNNFTQNIMVYGFDGKYQRQFKDPLVGIKDFVYNMDCDSVGNILLSFSNEYGSMSYKYVVIDSSCKILHQEPNYDIVELNAHVFDIAFTDSPFYSFKNTMFYRGHHNDTVYRIEHNKCVASYVIHVPNKLTLEQYVKVGAHMMGISDIKGKNSIYTIRESERYLFIRNMIYDEKHKRFLSLYDKHKHEFIGNIDPEITNDIDGGINFEKGYQDDTYAYILLWPFEMKKKLTSAHFAKTKVLYPEKQKALKTMVDNLLDEDNPVVMLVKLK
jgi:hypothetical protein